VRAVVNDCDLLKTRLGGRRIRFTDAECRRLARRAYALGRKVLDERPRIMKTIVDLVLRMALENARGDTRGSVAHWPIWDIRPAEAPSRTSDPFAVRGS
jgi:hypothetical protein